MGVPLLFSTWLVSHHGLLELVDEMLAHWSGLVPHSGLLGIAEFVAELVAQLGFGTHCDNCFLVGGPHTTESSTGNWSERSACAALGLQA